ncbi:hypothetical protein [Marinomonas spartinae]|uniref:hypothetical protein n=1 Tax=Marinomonas spartinae TaxID=1792290 RepID=UPI0018F1D8EF|nr:hypothetical protein [Marinomonas spartinae]MBJ7553157.1 hypothetical protein [Marinomonas spartinae]
MNYPDSNDLYNGKFTDGDPAEGRLASIASAEHMNAVYDELINVIEGAGEIPNHTNRNQLLGAINRLRKDELYDTATDYFATQGRKNILVNGKPQVWQNGESFSSTGYTADQWYTVLSSATCIRDPDPKKGMLIIINSDNGDGQFHQLLEQLAVKRLRGHTLTFSAEYAVNAAFRGDLKLEVFYSNNSDMEPSVNASIGHKSFTPLSSSTGVESFTFDVPTDAVGLRVALLPVSNQPKGAEMALYNAQLELGEKATRFEYSHYSDELIRCFRYFYKRDKRIHLHSYTGSTYNHDVMFPTAMRSLPSVSLIGVYGNVVALFSVSTYNWSVLGIYLHNNDKGSTSGNYVNGLIADARL